MPGYRTNQSNLSSEQKLQNRLDWEKERRGEEKDMPLALEPGGRRCEVSCRRRAGDPQSDWNSVEGVQPGGRRLDKGRREVMGSCGFKRDFNVERRVSRIQNVS